ncbi:MAG: hypothetical protein ACFFBH_05000 [Promethearchaeota archaeon]
MSFSIPRQKISDMVLYIWKIINLPYISFNDLLYIISFELFLYNPKEAEEFITNAIKRKYLIQDDNNNLRLSENLSLELKGWQENRKSEILQKINSIKRQNELEYQFQQNNKSEFNILLKGFSDKPTLNRAVSILGSAFKFQLINLNKGLIKASVRGSEDQPYIIEIDSNNKSIMHNCHDFQTRKSKEKRFCKHLVRLFLLLKEKDEISSVSLLKKISVEIEEWDFSN